MSGWWISAVGSTRGAAIFSFLLLAHILLLFSFSWPLIYVSISISIYPSIYLLITVHIFYLWCSGSVVHAAGCYAATVWGSWVQDITSCTSCLKEWSAHCWRFWTCSTINWWSFPATCSSNLTGSINLQLQENLFYIKDNAHDNWKEAQALEKCRFMRMKDRNYVYGIF